jgi:hypothetical protein
MSRRTQIGHTFVDQIPPTLDEGVLYVSIPLATAVHVCMCGCGSEVVTPLSPTDWSLIYDGETVGLNPSVGNWSFPCRSHYVLKRGRVVWASGWSLEKVASGRQRDVARKREYFGEAPAAVSTPDGASRWTRLLRSLLRRR